MQTLATGPLNVVTGGYLPLAEPPPTTLHVGSFETSNGYRIWVLKNQKGCIPVMAMEAKTDEQKAKPQTEEWTEGLNEREKHDIELSIKR
jgi:hypothetical protein